MAPSDRFLNFYDDVGNKTLAIGSELLVARRESFGNTIMEVVLALKPYSYAVNKAECTTASGTYTIDYSDIVRVTVDKQSSRRAELQNTSHGSFLLVSKSSLNIHVARVRSKGDSRALYGPNNETFWVDHDFHTRNFTPWLISRSVNQDIPQIYDISTNNKGINMIKSPNADKKVRGNTLAAYSDSTLLTTLVEINGINAAVEAGQITADDAVFVSSYTAKDLTDAPALLIAEIKFRTQRETLAEIARLEEEAEQLKSREERKAEVEKKLAALKSKVPAATVATAEEPVVTFITTPTPSKRKR